MMPAEPRAHTHIATLADRAEEYTTQAERRAVNASSTLAKPERKPNRTPSMMITTSNRSTVARRSDTRARRHVSSIGDDSAQPRRATAPLGPA
jgi:hypothetical protein